MKSRLVFFMLLSALAGGAYRSTAADVRIGVGVALPGLRIGINVPVYPRLVPVPGYPVYYAPQLDLNLFFYDGLYWAYVDDNWYSSAWYDGPWDLVQPDLVPYFVLRVPVLYYRRPPPYFREWDRQRAPHWDAHWGAVWRQRHPDWDRWDHSRAPAPAPLPQYQQQYSGPRYPGAREQRNLENRFNRQPPPARRPPQQRDRRDSPPQRPAPRDNRTPPPDSRGHDRRPADRPPPRDP